MLLLDIVSLLSRHTICYHLQMLEPINTLLNPFLAFLHSCVFGLGKAKISTLQTLEIPLIKLMHNISVWLLSYDWTISEGVKL